MREWDWGAEADFRLQGHRAGIPSPVWGPLSLTCSLILWSAKALSTVLSRVRDCEPGRLRLVHRVSLPQRLWQVLALPVRLPPPGVSSPEPSLHQNQVAEQGRAQNSHRPLGVVLTSTALSSWSSQDQRWLQKFQQ